VAEPSLWNFSVAFYALPGVSQSCLRLQDRYRIDVNQLMFAAWAGHVLGAQLSAAHVRELQEIGEFWQREVIEPVRLLRRRMKKTASTTSRSELMEVVQSMKEVELGAEKLELEQLERYASTRFSEGGVLHEPRNAIHNLEAVLRGGGVPRDAVQEALQAFRGALQRLP
jgi:uncharacterized protein (TIGR02444 family)